MGEWTYEKAGVSIEKAEAFVDYIKEKVQSLPRQALLFWKLCQWDKLRRL